MKKKREIIKEDFVQKSDAIVLKSVGLTVVDGLVSAVDNLINGGAPLLAIAWGLSKGMYGASIQLRQDRAIEFVEMIRDNPTIFTRQLLQTEEFQDGFVYVFQKYLSERAEEKRQIIKNIFCGFSQEENKRDFNLERFLYTLEQISIEDIEVVKMFSDGTTDQWIRNQFPDMEPEKVSDMAKQSMNMKQIGIHLLSEMKGMKQFENIDHAVETLSRLSSLGLVIGGIEATYDYSGSNFRESAFGREFISYVLK